MLFWALFGVYLLLQVADLVLTHEALRLGGHEANPLSRWLIERLGNVWIAGTLAKAPIAVLVGLSGEAWLAGAACLLYGWVVKHNADVVRELKA